MRTLAGPLRSKCAKVGRNPRISKHFFMAHDVQRDGQSINAGASCVPLAAQLTATNMNKITHRLAMAGIAALLALGVSNVGAQERRERGNFDPEQMRQRMMERYREALEVKSDDEWKVLEPRITKINDARREVGFGGARAFGRRGGDNGGGGGGGGNEQGGGDRRRFGGEPSPEAEALQKAIDAKAPAEEVKAKLAKYREARKVKEANLAKAQDELKKVLSVRQEAAAVMLGLLQ
jgi:hypothetical protein